MSDREHGTRARFVVDKCHCLPCRAANARYVAHVARMRAYGKWEPYVDATPVREHIEHLRAAGIGRRRIAAVAGLSESAVAKLIYGTPSRGMGPTKRVRHTTAERILAVTVEQAQSPGHYVPAGDTWALVMRMVCDGYPLNWIARQLHGPQAQALQIGRWQCTVRNARAIAELADRTQDVPGPSLRARLHAERYGWTSVLEPRQDEEPEQIQTRVEALVEDARWLIEGGLSVELIADRLDVAPGYLQKLLDRQDVAS